MKRWIRWAARVYPPVWRKRYGAEFDALLDDVRPSARDLCDVLQGALTMQIGSWRFRKLALAFGLAGALAAGVLAIRTPDRYSASAVLHINAPDAAAALEARMQLQAATLNRNALSEVIVKEDLYKGDRRRFHMGEVVQEMRNKHIRISPAPSDGANSFRLEFSDADAARARAVAGDLIASMMYNAPPRTLEVVSAPGDPTLTSPNRLAIVAAGLAVGLICGLLVWGTGRWPIVALSGAAVAVLAGGLSFLIPDTYISSAVVKGKAPLTPEAIEQVVSRENLQRIATSPGVRLYPQDLPINEVIEQMRRDIRIRPVGTTSGLSGAIQLQYRYTDRYKAQGVVRELVAAMATAPGVSVLDPPHLPEIPTSPNRLIIAVFGLVAGLLLGAAAQWRRSQRAVAAAL